MAMSSDAAETLEYLDASIERVQSLIAQQISKDGFSEKRWSLEIDYCELTTRRAGLADKLERAADIAESEQGS